MSDRADLTHASFFSGIGAFDLGLERAGFRVVSHAEVKPYSNSILETHWPDVPNLGDINAICPDGVGDHVCEIPYADVWSGGFPCSDFSIMGKRKGLLGGHRSSLGLVFLDLVRRHRPPFVVLENVPGLLSSHEGRDLGLLLGTLVDIGYGWAYRLLDARHFGLPQARRRIFVVAAADPDDAGAVLDDRTDRRVAAEALGRSVRTALAGGGDGPASDHPFVLGPTYAPQGRNAVRTDGTTFPILPNNFQYVPEPTVAQLTTRRGPLNVRADGTAYTILPTERQWVVDDEPIVLKRTGFSDRNSDQRRDGATFTIQPRMAGRDDQYVIDRGPGPVVLAGVFPKRREQRSPSRADGSSYTLTPGVVPYILEPGPDDDWDDLPVRGRDGDVLDGRRDDGRRTGDGADGGRPGASPGDPGQAADGRPTVSPGTSPDTGGVRTATGLSGRLDDPDDVGDDAMGPQHLDTARWHVLGRACPVPIVEWIGQGIATVITRQQEENRDDTDGRRTAAATATGRAGADAT